MPENETLIYADFDTIDTFIVKIEFNVKDYGTPKETREKLAKDLEVVINNLRNCTCE